MKGLYRSLLMAAFLLAGAAVPAQDFSVAEKRVFLDDHLSNIKHSGTLNYTFQQQSADTPGDSFEDTATVKVKDAGKGKKSTTVSYLSGAHKIELPDQVDVHSNPIILYFLEMDVRDMHRLVGGQEAYFRKRIRLALVDKALLRPVMITFNGHNVPASEVRITPYIDDPLKERFGKLYTKSYTFTISDQVPGGVYEIRTQVTDSTTATPDAAPLMKSVLTLKSAAV